MIRDKEEVNKAEAKLNEWVENYYNEHKSSEGYIKAFTEEVDIMHENQLFDKVGPHMGQIKRVCNPQTGLIIMNMTNLSHMLPRIYKRFVQWI